MVSTACAEHELCTSFYQQSNTELRWRSFVLCQPYYSITGICPTLKETFVYIPFRNSIPVNGLWMHVDCWVIKSLVKKLYLKQHSCRLLLSCRTKSFAPLSSNFSCQLLITNTTARTKNGYRWITAQAAELLWLTQAPQRLYNTGQSLAEAKTKDKKRTYVFIPSDLSIFIL